MDKAEILKAVGVPANESVDVPEWGTTITLKPLTVGEWVDAFNSGDHNLTAFRVLAVAIIDDKNKPVFTLDELAAMPANQAPVLTRLFQKARQLNGDIEGQKKKS